MSNQLVIDRNPSGTKPKLTIGQFLILQELSRRLEIPPFELMQQIVDME
jgi:hypothetical protein